MATKFKSLYLAFFLFTASLVLSSCYHHTRATQASAQPPSPVYVMPPPPAWAPPYNDREHVRYYYIPEMECYYDVYLQQYVYFDGFAWIHSPYPPSAYSSYNMYNGYIVVLNSNANEPWQNHSSYQSTYPRGSGNTAGTETLNGPRRGYNENDKSALYQHSTLKNADGTPMENKPAKPVPPKQRPAEQEQKQTPAPPVPPKAPKQMKKPLEDSPEMAPAPPVHKKEPTPEQKQEPKPKQQAPKRANPGPPAKGQKPQINPQ